MNCQRTQSLLSAFIDGELGGEDMLLIRQHVYSCQICHSELVSLQLVKRLLGSMDSVEADTGWISHLTACAYSGSKPWWERRVQLDSASFVFENITGEGSLSPRGRRMVRVLALSAVVVFLAASPFARYDRAVTSTSGNIAANMGMPMLFWPLHAEASQNFNTLSTPDVSSSPRVEYGYRRESPSSLRQVSDMLQGSDEPISEPNELTLTVSGH